MSIPAFPASTVVVLRDAEGGGLEVYMVRRPSQSSFLPGAEVFPGGRLEPDDDDTSWQALPGAPAQSDRPLAVAAVRELFEEAGLLLARDEASGTMVDLSARDPAALRALRRALVDGTRRFSQVCLEEGWRPALDQLVPCSRWVTPHLERRRFDTLFYVARAPEGQTAEADGQEAVAGRWIRPQDAVDEHGAGHIVLVPPTLKTLVDLRDVRSVEAALATAAANPVRTYAPRVFIEAGTRFVLMPGDEFYPVTDAEAMPPPTRYRLDGTIWRAD